MRIRLPLGRSVFFVCAFLFALVALLPLRLALDRMGLAERGLAAREAKGSLWLGVLSEAQLGPVPLGDLQARLHTLPLFVGKARVELSRAGEADPFRGALTVSRHSFGIDGMTGLLDIGSAVAPLPVASVDLAEVGVRFADGLCDSAEGRVKANVAGGVAGIMLPGGLSGNARCDQGALLLPLVGQSGMETLNLRLWEDGRYRVELAVKPVDDTMRDSLTASGFTLAGGAYALSAEGRF